VQGPGFSFHVPLPTWASAEPSTAEPPPPPAIDSGSICHAEARIDEHASSVDVLSASARAAGDAELDSLSDCERPLKVARQEGTFCEHKE
jgi:hypothetical protein